jgi:hypothetical protein
VYTPPAAPPFGPRSSDVAAPLGGPARRAAAPVLDARAEPARPGDRRREVDAATTRWTPRGTPGPHDQRHANGRLVHELLPVDDPVLALEEAVVGGEDDQRVLEDAGRSEGGDHARHALVDREQRFEPLPVARGQRRDVVRPERGPVPDRRRLVGDVRPR